MRALKLVSICSSSILAASCSTNIDAPSGPQAYALMRPATGRVVLSDYRIQPSDHLSVTVYREPDLSLADVPVDSAGKFALPLVGTVSAAGRTSEQLAQDITSALGSRYLKDPQVSVNVISAASQRVIVEGSVVQPGIYDIRGEMTLLGALALARGPDRVAKLNEIAIFRRVDGQLIAAKFDISQIRSGKAADPAIMPDDTVVVGFSGLKSVWRDTLQALPAFAVFTRL